LQPVEVPDAWSGDPDAGHQPGLAMVDALTALGRIDPTIPALRGLGRADGWLERQVARWERHRSTWPTRPGGRGIGRRARSPRGGGAIARYAEGSTWDLGAMRWYRVLACYRPGVILEGTHVRVCAGLALRTWATGSMA
jgi:aminoglycoside phosphotransferase (APT) family kinase protein